MTTKPEEIDFLEIQSTLRADASGSARAALEQRLEEAGRLLKRKLDAGVAPAEFTALNAMRGATEAAKEIVVTAWKRMHSTAS
ncbi:EscE/YscE/SsaE family type III secretion system needle protein co-chaperone [Hyphomicrobium sp. MC1]|uniref:EscE/YscE/SsaE family type III secretion system needle protein co-chaperone n=1 Tax=Hyphomicrobium sp. (strain MC1) TaxID=717785 RepID=UPI0002EAB9AA|nr:EscE/YscE/SsaE family type III secretion system needle protein co-chaperone [Hyphomicrobium sp. MC1]